MFSTSFLSADAVLGDDDFGLIESTDTNVPALALPSADEPIENLNLGDYLVFPPQDGADELRRSSPAQTINLASLEPTLGGDAVDVPQLTTHPGLDLDVRNLTSTSSGSSESVNILQGFDVSTELPMLDHSTQPILAETHIDHSMVSSADDTNSVLIRLT